jgi:hypothetical protein
MPTPTILLKQIFRIVLQIIKLRIGVKGIRVKRIEVERIPNFEKNRIR